MKTSSKLVKTQFFAGFLLNFQKKTDTSEVNQPWDGQKKHANMPKHPKSSPKEKKLSSPKNAQKVGCGVVKRVKLPRFVSPKDCHPTRHWKNFSSFFVYPP